MVQQHIGGAGGVRAGIVADNGIKTECCFNMFILKPAIEKTAGALGEQIVDIPMQLVAAFGDGPELHCCL